MRVEDAKKCLNELDAVRWLLHLQDWKITISWDRLESRKDDRCAGECYADPLYKEAHIRIDAEHNETEEDLLFTLRHEMIHIMICQFETYRRQIGEITGDNQFETLDVTFTYGVEQTVWNIQAMLDQALGLSPHKMIKNAKRLSDRGWNCD